MQIYRIYGKRFLDVIVASLALIVVLPALLVVAIVVRCFIGRPVLFRQDRAGLHGRPFQIVKFRTMLDTQDATGKCLPDEHRLTRVGRFLRATSLDELLELWNVLRGEMSLVGPRPLLMQYLDRYTPQQARRHEVKPGLTGLAQVYGRNAISWHQKFAYDLQYIDELSPWLDLRILAKTIVQVLRRDGISAVSHSTMPLFIGSEADHGGQPSRAA